MPLQIDAFLLILRLLLIVLLYLFLMQVVIAITRDLRKTSASASAGQGPATLGHLVVVDSGPSSILPGTRFALAPQTNIGRGPTNTIQLPDKFISAEHTRLWYHNGIWYVQDAGSVNGTYVNNQPAREAIPAKIGDIVRVGYIQFKLTQ
ncbi:MAG TPA: FHA domain-containing protein [Ktedonobacteraceae bacterium]|jgi:pSer/pThr/pTyr-binding forkhead associated (FHA) protein|nr:FHA domain-containing protein [Ktedonobacteraceae bacterium]